MGNCVNAKAASPIKKTSAFYPIQQNQSVFIPIDRMEKRPQQQKLDEIKENASTNQDLDVEQNEQQQENTQNSDKIESESIQNHSEKKQQTKIYDEKSVKQNNKNQKINLINDEISFQKVQKEEGNMLQSFMVMKNYSQTTNNTSNSSKRSSEQTINLKGIGQGLGGIAKVLTIDSLQQQNLSDLTIKKQIGQNNINNNTSILV